LFFAQRHLSWLSFTIDGVAPWESRTTIRLVNLVLFLSTVGSVLNVLFALIAGFWAAAASLPNILGRLLVLACCMVRGVQPASTSWLVFLTTKKTTGMTICQWLFNLFAFYLVFICRGGIKVNFGFHRHQGLVIESSQMFSGKLHEFLPITWV